MRKTLYLCETHGEFFQTPNRVQQRLGCQKCGRLKQWASRKLPAIRLEEDAKKAGLAFKGGFVRSSADADYDCPIHGAIRMRPASVSVGRGCRACGLTAGGLKRRKAKKTHVPLRQAKISLIQLQAQAGAVGLCYADAYVPSSRLAKYTCETHGEIEMYPSSVRNGRGCRFCAGNTIKTDAQLEIEAIRVNLNYIGPYKGDSTPTVYECVKHGLIMKAPGLVRAGRICRYCAQYGFDPVAPAVFYVYRVDRIAAPSFIGYGLTKDHATRHAAHMAVFRAANASAELLATFALPSGREAADLEIYLRAKLKAEHIKTDLPGFKEEAIAVEAEAEVLSIIAEWLFAKHAETRSAA